MECALLLPDLLPLRLDSLRIVVGQFHFPRCLDFAVVVFLGTFPSFWDGFLLARRRDLVPNRSLAVTSRPTNLHSAATFLRSSPGLSIGVSKINARPASRRWVKIRRNAFDPILPFPICSCRSTREPSDVFESFACTTG